MTDPLTITIGGSPVTFIEDSLVITRKISDARRCQVTVLDYAGNQTYTYNEQITVTDSTLGILFSGFVIDDKLDKSNTYPDPTVLHQIDTTDNIRIAAKRTSNRLYVTPTLAGKIAVDMVSDVLGAEGVLATYAVQTTTTQADWNTGNDQSVTGANTVGDGDLELVSSSSLGATYSSAAQWNTGTYSNTAAGTHQDISLIGQTRNWNDGNKANQTLYGLGSPSDSVSAGVYYLYCVAQSETRSRQDWATTWQIGTIEVDLVLTAGNFPGFTFRTTGWSNVDGTYAYAVELTTAKIAIRKGSNGVPPGTSSELVSASFSPALSPGTYRVGIVMNGSSFSATLNGVTQCSTSDGSYGSAGYIALRNRDGSTSALNQQFDNFGVMQAKSGTWVSPGQALDAITTIASSVISWDTSLSAGGTIKVETSTNNGTSYTTATNGGAIPGLAIGGSGAGLTLKIRVTLSNTTTAALPDIRNLIWNIFGGYLLSGSRSTAPLGIDTMVRANQSGFGTADDGQAWTKTGTGTDAIASNEATITNTTGDVYEQLGSASGADSDVTVRFSLSASTISAGIALRFLDTNNYFRLMASTTTLTATKDVASTITTIATAAKALATGTFYYMRFRVFSTGPTSIQGRVWQAGTLEPTTWDINTTS